MLFLARYYIQMSFDLQRERWRFIRKSILTARKVSWMLSDTSSTFSEYSFYSSGGMEVKQTFVLQLQPKERCLIDVVGKCHSDSVLPEIGGVLWMKAW